MRPVILFVSEVCCLGENEVGIFEIMGANVRAM